MANSENHSEEDLLKALRKGKVPDAAIRQLYLSYFGMVSAYIRQNTGNQQDEEDIFQEVIMIFIELVQKQKFREESSIRSILYSITRHVWLNELKRKRRALKREVRFEREKEGSQQEWTAQLADHESKAELMRMIDSLGETCKKVLLSFYYDGLSMREILGNLNYQNEQVLRNKKYKCMKQLEQILAAKPNLIQQFKSTLL
jgi:RNA polymerase sigma factor (sigma-70 family)